MLSVYFALLPIGLGALGAGIGLWEHNFLAIGFGLVAVIFGVASAMLWLD